MRLVPARITPPAKPLKGLAFLATFVRNPLEVAPQAVYEEDLVANPVGSVQRLWITSPALVKVVLLDEREKFQKQSQIRLLAPLLGEGVLTSEGADGKWQRQASAHVPAPGPDGLRPGLRARHRNESEMARGAARRVQAVDAT
jgi:hypothetical protein